MNNSSILKSKIISANDAYRTGNSIMSDAEYDELLEQYEKSVSEAEYSKFRNSLNEGSVESGSKLVHKYIMGSLDKIKNIDHKALNDFIKTKVKNRLNISAKVDGISSVAQYVNGKLVSFASRGDGYKGVSFMNKAPHIKGLKQEIDYRDEMFIRGELVILNSEEIDSDTNYRNVCAGYMNSKTWDPEDIKKVSFIPYTILGDSFTKNQQFELIEKLGFNCAWHMNIDKNMPDLMNVLTEYAKMSHDYTCDGLVLIDENAYNEINEYRPSNSKALKINELTGTTRVADISWEGPTKDGFLIPVLNLEPLELGGAVISRATGSNLDVLEKLGIKYGSVVKITKSGDIIPHVDEVLDNSDTTGIELPEVCPCCDNALVRDGVNLRCKNKNCKDQTTYQVMHFIKKFEVESANFKTLQKFNIYTINDLLAFTPNERYKSEVKLANELSTKMFTQSKEALLAAMNFQGIGETIASKIISEFGYDSIKNDPEIIKSKKILGVGDSFIQKFLDDVVQNICYVEKIIHDVRYHYSASSNSNAVKSISTGKSVCFTGKLETMGRNEASKLAKNAGYEVLSGVNKKLTYLVTNDTESGSSKNKKAKELGVKVINENEFLKMIENETIEESINDL